METSSCWEHCASSPTRNARNTARTSNGWGAGYPRTFALMPREQNTSFCRRVQGSVSVLMHSWRSIETNKADATSLLGLVRDVSVGNPRKADGFTNHAAQYIVRCTMDATRDGHIPRRTGARTDISFLHTHEANDLARSVLQNLQNPWMETSHSCEKSLGSWDEKFHATIDVSSCTPSCQLDWLLLLRTTRVGVYQLQELPVTGGGQLRTPSERAKLILKMYYQQPSPNCYTLAARSKSIWVLNQKISWRKRKKNEKFEQTQTRVSAHPNP